MDDSANDVCSTPSIETTAECSGSKTTNKFPIPYSLPDFPIDVKEYLHDQAKKQQPITSYMKSRIVNILYLDMSKYNM